MWIARDKGGDVNLFWSEKPQRIEDDFWGNENNWRVKIPIGLVPVMISWEDEPIEVEFSVIKPKLSGTKIFPSLEDMISESKESKTVELPFQNYTPQEYSEMGIHFICRCLRRNVTQYFCSHECSNKVDGECIASKTIKNEETPIRFGSKC